jgi:predicted SprT family Zn-dependent metalloprotease
MSRYLFVLLFSVFIGPYATADQSVLPDPPFPVMSDYQVAVYHAALRGLHPGMSDEHIAETIARTKASITDSIQELLARGRMLYGLPKHDTGTEWNLVGYLLGEAHPDRIRLNLILAILDPNLFLASVIRHEVAHVLYFEKYGSGECEWNDNAKHDERWESIVRDLDAVVVKDYPTISVRPSMLLTAGLVATAKNRAREWLVAVGSGSYQREISGTNREPPPVPAKANQE